MTYWKRWETIELWKYVLALSIADREKTIGDTHKKKKNLIVIFAALLEKDQQNIGDTKYYNIKKVLRYLIML